MTDAEYAAALRKRVNALKGSPDDLAAQTLALIGRCPRDPDATSTPQEWWQHHKAVKARELERAALKQRMAADFGARRGWRLSRHWFSAARLAGRRSRNQPGVWRSGEGPLQFFDHSFFYRRDRHPAAIVSHPYNMDADKRSRVQAWAAAAGLVVEFPDDYPSWWYPGRTTLTVFTRQDGGA